jgi:CHAT domain-containing protein
MSHIRRLACLFAVLAPLTGVSVSGRQPRIQFAVEHCNGNGWLPIHDAEFMSVGVTMDFRLRATATAPVYFAICGIDSHGQIVPLWPWVDEQCSKIIPDGQSRRQSVILDGSAVHDAMKRNGQFYDGQYCFLILASEEATPNWNSYLPHRDIRRQLHLAITMPMYALLQRGEVESHVWLCGQPSVRPDDADMNAIISEYRRVTEIAEKDSTISTALLCAFVQNAIAAPSRTQEVMEFRRRHQKCWSLLRTGSLRDADAQSREIIEGFQLIYPQSLFPGGHIDLVHSTMLRGSVRAFLGDSTTSVRLFRESLEKCNRLHELAPTIDTQLLRATIAENLAVQLLENGDSKEALDFTEIACRDCVELLKVSQFAKERVFVTELYSKALLTRSTAAFHLGVPVSEVRRQLSAVDELISLSTEQAVPTKSLSIIVDASRAYLSFLENDHARAKAHLLAVVNRFEQEEGWTDYELLVLTGAADDLMTLYVNDGDLRNARRTASRLSALLRRERKILEAPQTIGILLLAINRLDDGLASIIYGDGDAEFLMEICRDQLTWMEFGDVRTRSAFLSLAESVAAFDCGLAKEICQRAEIAARQDVLDNQVIVSRLHLVRALLIQASIDLQEGQVTVARLRYHEAIRELSRVDPRAIDVEERVELLLRGAILAAQVADDRAAERLYRLATRFDNDWMHQISHGLLARAACDAQRRLWKSGTRGVSEEFGRAWAREVDYSWSLLALSRFGENQQWAQRHELYSSLALAGARQQRCSLETAYQLCATRKRLANEAAKVWRSLLAQDNDRSRTLRAEIVAAQRRSVGTLYWPLASTTPPTARVADTSGLHTRDTPLHWQAVELANDQQLLARRAELDQHDWRDFPPQTVVIDVFRRRPVDLQQASAERSAPYRYFAFVLQRDTSPRLVDLGDAESIDAQIAAWRTAIRDNRDSPAARWLREQLWNPLERQFAGAAQRVYICPEGSLATLPWAALPGRQPDSVLLEDYSLALLPHGLALLNPPSIDSSQQSPDRPVWLLVGNVDYAVPDQSVVPADAPKNHGTERLPRQWSPLPGTRDELQAVVQFAPEAQLVRLEGAAASTDGLLARLPQAHWVHIATHGFFAGPDSQMVPNAPAFARRARHDPLQLSGLVLAGANQPPRLDRLGLAEGDGGLLTGSVIASLPLDRVQTVVLSACETGLGTSGEGSLGLQRAFHQAGADNVIATLWNVDDQATASLMSLFYYHTHRRNLSPLEALRQAQLTVRRHPSAASQLASLRGPDFRKAAQQLRDDASESTISGVGD